MPTWVIIPAYQESNTIARVVKNVLSYVKKVVVVDDGSKDDTSFQAEQAGAIVLQHAVNCGYGAALITGTEYALQQGADIVVHFDADGQFEASEIPALVAKVTVGKPNAALGSRFLGKSVGLPPLRRLTLKLGIIFTWFFSGIRLSDTHNGFRALTSQAINLINLRQAGMAYSSELIDQLARAGVSITEVPVTVYYTKESLKGSKQGAWPALKIARDFLIGKFLH